MKIYDFLKLSYSNDKISHVFLIGNTDYRVIKDELNEVISDFIFEKKIFIDNSPDVYVINNNNNNISKDNINDLLKNIQISSQIEGKKVYIINNVNKLNNYSYNALLKTIEEPSENIYGILIAQNIDNVPETIKSRCQKIFISTSYNEITNTSVHELSLEILNNIEKLGYKTIALHNDIYIKIETRDMVYDIINELCDIYIDIYSNFKKNVSGIFDMTINHIDEKLLFLTNLYLNNNININKDLLIDEMVFGLWRLNNEYISSTSIKS